VLTVGPTFLARDTVNTCSVSEPSHARLWVVLITLLYLALAGEPRRKFVSARTTTPQMTDRFGSPQVYSDDDHSDDHVFEEGRYLATGLHEYGTSDCATDEYTGYISPARCGQHPTLRIQIAGLTLGMAVPSA